MRRFLKYVPAILLLALPFAAESAGKHEALNCTGCHGTHNAKGALISAVEPNNKAINPVTKTPYNGVTAICLGCHETVENGGMGIMPVSATMSHPYGIAPNAKVANVPAEFLRGDKVDCVGCHDPHPSNPNYKYLRVDTNAGANMQNFCTVCHAMKSGAALREVRLFNSMDERFVPADAQAPAGNGKASMKKSVAR